MSIQPSQRYWPFGISGSLRLIDTSAKRTMYIISIYMRLIVATDYRLYVISLILLCNTMDSLSNHHTI